MRARMEGRRGELALAAGFIGLSGALALFDVRSELAVALRDGAPLLGLFSLSGAQASEPARRFLAAYQPALRSLALAELPSETGPAPRGRRLEAVEAAVGGRDGRFRWPGPFVQIDSRLRSAPASAGAFKAWIEAWPRGLEFWIQAARAGGRAVSSWRESYDAALVAMEAYRLDPAQVRLAAWPAAASLRQRLVAQLLAPSSSAAEASTLKVEVLNASGESGIALQATKVLRWHRVDVVEFANAPAPLARTRVVDRSGRPLDARRVAELLGCPDAELWTSLEPEAPAPVAVLLGRDFRGCVALAN